MPKESEALLWPRFDPAIVKLALEAQEALLPQALGVFVLTLPIYVWLGSQASNSAFMAVSFVVFGINWAAFYAIVGWLRRNPTPDIRLRQRVHVLGGLLWAFAVIQIAVMANGAGPAREALLMASVAAGAMCVFFNAPSLAGLLIVAPVAMAGPLTALASSPETRLDGRLALGAFALVFLLSLILNQMLRRQFALAVERESLVAAREVSLGEAERLARSKSDLIATLSSEIRNGLAAVEQVLTAAAGNAGRAAPSREQLGAALAGVNELVAVLNATLDSESAAAGDLAVANAPFDAVALIRDVIGPWRAQAIGKGLEFSVYIDPEVGAGGGAALADAARVRQIVTHLVGNAVRYTVRGRVEVRLERRADSRLIVAVADTGPGLSPEELDQACQPFRRVARTAAGVPGAGLGLSLSRSLAELMGASIAAESAVGVGACFTLELPYDPRAGLDAAAEEGLTAGRRELKVLVAESDSLTASALRAILEQLGHKVVQAHDGGRALDLALSLPFDLVIIAARLATLSGPEAIARIRAAKGPARDVPVIAVIDGAGDEARACGEAGAGQIMRKPLTVGAVARAVTDALQAPPPEAARDAA